MRANTTIAALSRIASLLASVLLLASCTGTAPDQTGHSSNIEGKMLHTLETFTGKSTADIDGDGAISLTSDRGARCSGPYRQVADGNSAEVGAAASSNGVATLTCNDGRTGSVMFTVGPNNAIGTGMLGQDIVTLTIAE